jgi:hypothetical protein
MIGGLGRHHTDAGNAVSREGEMAPLLRAVDGRLAASAATAALGAVADVHCRGGAR